MVTLTNPHFRLISDHHFGQVRLSDAINQKFFFARKSFKPGDLIIRFSAGTTSDEPTYLTIQLGDGHHITMQPEFLQYINHSCDPNVFFNTSTMEVIALKEIRPEEEMTFFYPSSEWEMIQPFKCFCGSPRCLKEIKGAAFLPKNVLKQYRFTDFIQQQLARRWTRKVRA